MISAVLNSFKRHSNLQKQIDSCLSQSLNVNEIVIWNNGKYIKKDEIKIHKDADLLLINSSKNTGVWTRFSVAMICRNEFILVLDDDTIPGKDFCKNCLQSFKQNPGLYGSRGLRFLTKRNYEPYNEYGWLNPNDTIVDVDIVGHSWFFPKEYLSYFWNDNLANKISPICGEDIHFSYSIQKYGNLKTFVPPHPKNNLHLWGSIPTTGISFGADENAISKSKNAIAKFESALKLYRSKGFKMILVDKIDNKINNEGERPMTFKKKLMFYFPTLYKIIKKIFR